MKTIGLYMAKAVEIAFNAKKEKDTGKVLEKAVSWTFSTEALMARVKLNGHTLEDVGTDYLLKMVEKAVKSLKSEDGKSPLISKASTLEEVTTALEGVWLEVRTPEVETISASAKWEEDSAKYKALGIKDVGALKTFLIAFMDDVVVVD